MKHLKLAIAALALSMGIGAAQAQDVLKIGVEGAYPPFSEKLPDGKLVGFDIDIAWALCAEMKRTCELVEQDWDGMIPALIEKKFDAIIASMSVTPDRLEKVDFSKKYYNTPAMFYAKAGSGLSDAPGALKGKKVGVQRGTIHQTFMEAKYPEADLVLYGSQDEVYLDLVNGRLDAGMSDSIAADDGFLKTEQGKGFAFFGKPHSDPAIHGEGAGVAVRKGDKALADAFTGAIAAIRASGKYDEIRKKYFAFDIYGS